MKIITLFDIDGTLLTSGAAGRAALDAAFLAQLNIPAATKDIRLAGRTDPGIVRATLRAHGQDENDAIIWAVLETYLHLLPGILQTAETTLPKPGALETTKWLQGRNDVGLGLGTGNLEAGAMAKLDKVGLSGRFDFGGYGSDHEERPQVIAAGIQRGLDHLGCGRQDCKVLIIGDTPSDIGAAKANDGLCLAVASGPYGMDELRNHGADWVAQDLADPAVRAAFEQLGVS